jgi:hypothetical protein
VSAWKYTSCVIVLKVYLGCDIMHCSNAIVEDAQVGVTHGLYAQEKICTAKNRKNRSSIENSHFRISMHKNICFALETRAKQHSAGILIICALETQEKQRSAGIFICITVFRGIASRQGASVSGEKIAMSRSR